MVCALSEYALLCIRASRFGMGASEIASGRSPSMDRINTRRACGVGVVVGVCVAVSVAVAVNVAVEIGVGVRVDVRLGREVAVAKGNPARLSVWQAQRMSIESKSKNFWTVFMK